MQIDKFSSLKMTSNNIQENAIVKNDFSNDLQSDVVEISASNKKKKNRNRTILASLGLLLLSALAYFKFRKKPPTTTIRPPEPPVPRPPVVKPESKPKWQEYNDYWALIDKYNNEMATLSEGEEKNKLVELRSEIVKKCRELEKQAKEENFSLIEKKDLSGLSEKERWDYFDGYAFGLMKHNEASAFDCIEMFEKYGVRKAFDPEQNVLGTTLEQFILSMPKNPSDALTSRLLEVLDKYITPENPNMKREVHKLAYLLLDNDYMTRVQLTEETLLKAIKLIKKMEFWTTDYKDIPKKINFKYCENKFKDSPRLGEIKQALNELEDLCAKHHQQ